MNHLNIFESWEDNQIDRTLFSSGRAKYNPKVGNKRITYHTGTKPPFYTAEILQMGNKFICNIYKHDSGNNDERVRHKVKSTLKTAHNYIREFLNDRMRKKKKEVSDDIQDVASAPTYQENLPEEGTLENPIEIRKISDGDDVIPEPIEDDVPPPPQKPRNQAIIRSFV